MSARPEPTAARDYSRGGPVDPDRSTPSPRGGWRPPRAAGPTAAIAVAVGAAAILLATVLPVLELRIPDRVRDVDTTISGWTRMKALLPMAGLAGLGLLGPALRGRGAAAAGLIGVGAATVIGLLALVAPRVGDVIPVGPAYDDGTVGSGIGWYLASGGAVALIIGGGVLAAVIAWDPAAARPRRTRRAAAHR